MEVEEDHAGVEVELTAAKRLMKDPLYCYPNGNYFLRSLCRVSTVLHPIRRRAGGKGKVACLYTRQLHRAGLDDLSCDPRPFP